MEDGLVKVISPIDDTPAPRPASWPATHHHIDRRRAGAGPDAESGRRQDARPEKAPIKLKVMRKGQTSRSTSR
jgi:hypothetical protein